MHRSPLRNPHDAPARCGVSPTVIVRTCDYREVQRVGKLYDVGSLPLNHADAFRRRVTQLDRVQSCVSSPFVLRQPGDVAGNGEYQQRWRAGEDERRVAIGIVPVALRIDREGGVDSDRDNVLVLIPCFQRRQQNRSITTPRRVFCRRGRCTGQALVVADIRDIESGPCMPRTIALRSEPAAPVP
jgi:hypothetical protein